MEERNKKEKRDASHFTIRGFRVMEENAMIRLSLAVDRGRGLRRMPDRIRLDERGVEELMSVVGAKLVELAGKELEGAKYLSNEEFDALFAEEA